MRRRQIAVLFALASIVSLIPLLLIACGDGGNDNPPTSTDGPRTTCKPAETVVPSTPGALPQGLAEYQSPERGYRVEYPSDWGVKPNAVAVGNISGDAFFTGDATGKINPNVSVTCETVPIGTTSGDFIDAKRSVILNLIGKLPDIEKTLTVNGIEAASVKYDLQARQTPEPITMDKVEVYFADDMGGWTIAFTTPKGAIDTYRAAFDSLVQSYHRP